MSHIWHKEGGFSMNIILLEGFYCYEQKGEFRNNVIYR